MKDIMFMWGIKGPFEAHWDPKEQDCPRIDVGGGFGLILPDDTPEHSGAEFIAERYDVRGRHVGIAQCRTV